MKDGTLSRGAVALQRKMNWRGAQAQLRREIGCAEGMVSRWLSGQRTPSAVQAAWLEKKFGIRVAWWGEPAPDKG